MIERTGRRSRATFHSRNTEPIRRSLPRPASCRGCPPIPVQKIGGKVTPQSLYRGFTAGDLIGPYISQLFIQPFSYGLMPFIGYKTTLPGDFGIDAGSWLNIQNGAPAALAPSNPDPTLSIAQRANLAELVHADVPYMESQRDSDAGQDEAPLNSGNPYPPTLKSETGFITFGIPMVQEVGVYVSRWPSLFGLAVGVTAGWVTAAESHTGYLTEYSLSLDNLFVFSVIMTWFGARLPGSPGSCCSASGWRWSCGRA